ncbi:hypothetical protein GCK72_021389 [Caenorhabditis remanei]|uniref:F-box domain-containing protein n=1 Tax=Caenorhabditis remanei TaxID=31234 RepID=A0A6A5GJU0_CAERE|nr:hypothetical protein GCK72_021389 [Caenorhabditis remanei]KAF1754825.1 hypothetical protein GCK72_021389 [Caenorhabditis remanei]
MTLKPTLLSLPEVVKDHLMQYLNYIDIARLRKTCHLFRRYLHLKLPDANIHSIHVYQNENSMELNFKAGHNEDLLKIEYKKVDEGSSIEANFQQGGTRIVRADGRNYLDVFCDDFTMLLKHQKLISHELAFIALEAPEKRTEFWDMIRKVITDTEATSGKKLLLKKRSVILRNLMAPDVFSILPYFDASCLQMINITGEEGVMTPLDGIVELEHWNCLEVATLNNFSIGNVLQNITHLVMFSGGVRAITAQDVLVLKNKILHSDNMNFWLLIHENFNEDQSLYELLGPIFVLDEEGHVKNWNFRTQVEDIVLEIEVTRQFMCFEMMPVGNVVENAVFIDYVKMNSESPLVKMPDVAKMNLVEYLNYVDILRIKKTCRTFRDMITDKKPITSFSSIQIHQKYYQIEFNLNSTIPEDSVKLKYTETKTGCSVNAKYDDVGHRRVLEETDYIDALCKDLANFLKYQKTVTPELHLLNDAPERIELWRKIQKTLHETSQETKTKLLFKAKCCKIRNLEAPDILALLPYFDYNILRKISITPKEYQVNLNEIIDLPQWKHATSAVVDQVCIENLGQNILHMNNIAGHTVRLTEEDVVVLKNTFLRNPHFDYCQLSFKYPEDGDDILTPLGRPSLHGCSGNPDQKTWFFRRRGETGYVLSVEYDGIILFYEKLNVKDVPKKAKVME